MYKIEEITDLIILSSYLRTSPENIYRIIYANKLIFDSKKSNVEVIYGSEYPKGYNISFQRFYIPKKNKRLGYRVVYKCQQQIVRDVLKTLELNLNALYTPNNYVHGYIIGRNTKSNAYEHLGKGYLLNLDIKNFFESIDISTIISTLADLGFNEEVSTIIASICTIKGKLVQGFPTSPVIANLVCSKMDQQLKELCGNCIAIYTRYADDISISSDENLPLIKDIEYIVKKHGFSLNHKKTKIFKKGQNQYVTGLSISDSLHPRIPKPMKKRLRQELHYIGKFGYESHICRIYDLDEERDSEKINEYLNKIRNRIKGWIDYINAVEPILAKTLYIKFNEIEMHRMERNIEYLKNLGEEV